MAWIKVTQPDGHVVWINSDQIVRVRLPITEQNGAAVIETTAGQQATKESVETVMEKILSGSV